MSKIYDVCIDPESVAYWFFRLNGCLTIQNFMLHRHDDSNPYTDGDLLAVRFPHRTELEKVKEGGMVDHDIFMKTPYPDAIQFFLVEIKYRNEESSPELQLNRSWLRDKTVLEEFLKRIGLFPKGAVESTIADALHHNWSYYEAPYYVRVLAVAQQTVKPLPPENHLTWDDKVLPFIYKRFNDYDWYKRNHSQWDDAGHKLYSWAVMEKLTKDDYIQKVNRAMETYKQHRGCEGKNGEATS